MCASLGLDIFPWKLTAVMMPNLLSLIALDVVVMKTCGTTNNDHDDVIKWKHFQLNWPFGRESTGHRWVPPTKAIVTRGFGAFFDLHPNKRLSKQSSCWWFETPSRSLWRHCNDKIDTRTTLGFHALYYSHLNHLTSPSCNVTIRWDTHNRKKCQNSSVKAVTSWRVMICFGEHLYMRPANEQMRNNEGNEPNKLLN